LNGFKPGLISTDDQNGLQSWFQNGINSNAHKKSILFIGGWAN
jgi:hypothetical protein